MSSRFSTLKYWKKQFPNLTFFPQGNQKQIYREYCCENKGSLNSVVFYTSSEPNTPIKYKAINIFKKSKKLSQPL